AHQDRDRARAGARPAQRHPRRADQRPGRDDHPRAARIPAPAPRRRTLRDLLQPHHAGGGCPLRPHRRRRPRPGGRAGKRRRAARAGRDGQPRGRIRPAHRIGRRTAGKSALLIVWKKELTEFVRDRRTIALTLLFGPLLAPLLFMGLTSLGESKAREQMEKPLQVAIVGAEHAPNLVSWLAGQGIERKEVADPEAAVRAQEDDAYLSIEIGRASWR